MSSTASSEPSQNRITDNPHLERCPDFSGPAWQVTRDGLPGSDKDTIQVLSTAWSADHERRVELWDAQVASDEATTAASAESEHIRIEELAKDAEVTRQKEALEAEKKKPKLGNFECGKLAPDAITPRPLAFATQKVWNREYVELDYLTVKGLSATAKSNPNTSSNDTFTFLQGDDGGLTLQPTLSNISSKSVRPDDQLTSVGMSTAKTGMLEDIKQANWPEEHVLALVTFFHHLENHPLRQEEHGEDVLVQYQAKTQKEWFHQLKDNDGRAFDISFISPSLLSSTKEKYHDDLRNKKYKEVRTAPLHLTAIPPIACPGQTGVINGFFGKVQAHPSTSTPLAPFVWEDTHTTFTAAARKLCGTEKHRRGSFATPRIALSTRQEPSSASDTTSRTAAGTNTSNDTSVQDAGARLMELKNALEHRRTNAVTPLIASAWHEMLSAGNLLQRYPHIPNSICFGFDIHIP
ncbi:hypothetical protein PQX77_001716 [Marasmius sp. AFHP31]|nr:hypothetical protein PQX77_001716 [Marasmius sp. AFHP31]